MLPVFVSSFFVDGFLEFIVCLFAFGGLRWPAAPRSHKRVVGLVGSFFVGLSDFLCSRTYPEVRRASVSCVEKYKSPECPEVKSR